MATLTGVQPSQVGSTYDLALGYDPGTGSAVMIGYVITPGSEFDISTDISDEEHMVQVSSPNQTDRYTRYPKVSQSDFSGGERQAVYADPTKYYYSYNLETTIPGELKLIGKHTVLSMNNIGDLTPGSGSLSSDANYFYVATIGNSAGNVNFATVQARSLVIYGYTYAGGGAGVYEIVRGGDQQYLYAAGGASDGPYQQTSVNPGTRIAAQTIWQGSSRRTMAYFGGSLWYLLNGAAQSPLVAVTYPFPGQGAAGTTKDTIYQMETQYNILGNSPVGLVMCSGYTGVGGCFIYTFNGSTRTLVGIVEGVPIDIREAGGTTYILLQGSGVNSQGQPIIYALSTSGQLSVFDDYRTVPSDFKAVPGTATSGDNGRLDTDGRHLFLAWPGLGVKRYSLSNPNQATAVVDVGAPNAPINGTNIHLVACATADGSILEAIPVASGNNWYSVLNFGDTVEANGGGWMGTSSYDFGTPSVAKSLRSVEVELRHPLPAGASVVMWYVPDNSTTIYSLTQETLPNGNLIGYFPTDTKAYRVQIQLNLKANASGAGPVIRSLSVKATLARAIKATLSCRRHQQTRQLTDDPQGLSAQSLLANIVNAHRQAAGNVILYIPDPASATGVSQVNATLEEYHQKVMAGAGPGLRADDEGSWDMEADVEVLLTENV